VERIVIGITTLRQSDCDCNVGNLNAYNVLMQQGIVKPEDYSEMAFSNGMNNQLCEKPLANHSNKKAAGV
jgi:hypothetical protein